jgi:hypothetical protein
MYTYTVYLSTVGSLLGYKCNKGGTELCLHASPRCSDLVLNIYRSSVEFYSR